MNLLYNINMRSFHSHGSGKFTVDQFKTIGQHVIFETGVLVFHPEHIIIGNNVYVGHRTILKGYYQNTLKIGNDVWIGQECFLHSGGGIVIEDKVGLGPRVMLLTIIHKEQGFTGPIIDAPQIGGQINIETGCDIGVGTIILPGVTIGKYSQIGAGSVITKNIPSFSVAAGVPAKILRSRK